MKMVNAFDALVVAIIYIAAAVVWIGIATIPDA